MLAELPVQHLLEGVLAQMLLAQREPQEQRIQEEVEVEAETMQLRMMAVATAAQALLLSVTQTPLTTFLSVRA
jgi:hypothetical protein